jgi:translation initiation factor 2 subunit 2
VKDAAATEDLDFSDLKKKKKSSKKKAAFDMEAFEKELEETKAKEEDEDGGENDGVNLDDIDEGELGDDPFARGDAPSGLDGGDEPWLKSDRDYSYPEVMLFTMHHLRVSSAIFRSSFSIDSTRICTLPTLLC